MANDEALSDVPALAFSHLGISVTDIARMEAFYTGVLGFHVTDRGFVNGMDIVFLSRDPRDHHQVVLATGRPDNMPENTKDPTFGPSINQISFRLASIGDLKAMNRRLEAAGANQRFSANHGNAWSTYAKDPEGNTLEFFVDTAWYIPQPCLEPLDLSLPDAEIKERTRQLCESHPKCESMSSWQARMAAMMAGEPAEG